MMRRIARQQSANNFTGTYVSVLYERSWRAIQYGYVRDHFSLTYGFQSRFLRNGFLDFSLGLYYLRPFPGWYTSGMRPATGFQTGNLVLASRSLIGLALGDWKRTSSGPLCDVLHCDYLVKGHVKIKLPEVNIGLNNQSFRIEGGYERKLRKAPLSVNLSVKNETYRAISYNDRVRMNGETEAEAQVRFYYFQKAQIRKGKASDNLSGLYLGAGYGYRWEYEQVGGRQVFNSSVPIGRVSAGYQQRLFHKLYFDSAVSLTGVEFFNGFGKFRFGELNARAGVGFAL